MEQLGNLLPPLLQGAWVTLYLALCSTLLGGVLAFAAGIGKLSRFWPLRVLSTIYSEIFRGIPLLVTMFWIFFASQQNR